MISSNKKLIDWVNEHAIEGEANPEVVRFAKELLIQMEFGAFDPDEDELEPNENEAFDNF